MNKQQTINKQCEDRNLHECTKRRKNTFLKKALLTLSLLFTFCIANAQISIVNPSTSYYCGSVITLKYSPNLVNGESLTWIVDSGAIKIRPVSTNTSGTSVISNTTDTFIEVIVNGRGRIKAINSNGLTPYIDIVPSPANLNNLSITSSTTIHTPNGIQTTRGWVCLSNDGSSETITITNPSQLNVFWVVNGGAEIVSRTQTTNTNPFSSSITFKTTGPNAGKGFIRGFISDPCGTLTCDPAIDLEILKDIVPAEINGPTCLRDNNLDPNTNSVVYSIPDELAGNAVFRWELYDSAGNLVPANNPDFYINSQVLYGNSATIKYNGTLPSIKGNFSVKVINECGGSFTRAITVSPIRPIITQTTFCVPEASGSTKSITLPALLTGQSYQVTPFKNVNGIIELNPNWIVDASSNPINITFNDNLSGFLEIKAVSSTDANCTSEATLIYINREGAAPTITGPLCVQRNTTDAFTFTASPFGQYTWSITPQLAGFNLQNNGNTLTVTPPTSGIGVSGNYTVTASLEGCSTTQTATFDFEIGPEKPSITGDTCIIPGQQYTYNVTSDGAAYAIATVIKASGNVTSPPFPITNPYAFTALSENATVSITTYSATGCASLPTTIDIKPIPEINSISSNQPCIVFGQTPTVTFTANITGNVTDYIWSHPTQWTITDGGNGSPFITLQLDATTAGSVCLVGVNGTCSSEELCLNIPRNDLRVSVSKTLLNPSVGQLTITSTTNTPLEVEVRYSNLEADVIGCGGTLFPGSTTAQETHANFYLTGIPAYTWVSIKVRNPVTGCENCFHFNLSEMAVNSPINFKTNTAKNLDVLAYPNPVKDVLNVTVPSKNKVQNIQLFDIHGKTVYQDINKVNETKIDVSRFEKGTYILLVVTNNGAETKKIIIE